MLPRYNDRGREVYRGSDEAFEQCTAGGMIFSGPGASRLTNREVESSKTKPNSSAPRQGVNGNKQEPKGTPAIQLKGCPTPPGIALEKLTSK